MPTHLRRTQVTHTPVIDKALAVARAARGDASDSKLIAVLVEEGSRTIQAERQAADADREALLRRVGTRYGDYFDDDYLADIREGWAE